MSPGAAAAVVDGPFTDAWAAERFAARNALGLRCVHPHLLSLPTARSRTAACPAAGERLRALRIAANLSQVELAVHAGRSLQTIALAERTGFITPETAAKIAPLLGVEPDDLVAPPPADDHRGRP